MLLQRADLKSDLAVLRGARSASWRALGDNFLFEERISDARRAEFEGTGSAPTSLKVRNSDYFKVSVEGVRRSHVPSTFQSINNSALYDSDIEPNQKLVRIECIDDILRGTGRAFADLEGALAPGSRDEALIAQVVDQWRRFPGARPAYVAFKSELVDDLAQPDWLLRLRNRLGLGHYAPALGEHKAFALMEYLAKEAIDEWNVARLRGAERPFAFPTVLEAPGSVCFFPAPRETQSNFALDLADGAAQPPIRELLHLRITYRPQHLARVGELVGPVPGIELAARRDAHLEKLRRLSGRGDFGALMSGEVDD